MLSTLLHSNLGVGYRYLSHFIPAKPMLQLAGNNLYTQLYTAHANELYARKKLTFRYHVTVPTLSHQIAPDVRDSTSTNVFKVFLPPTLISAGAVRIPNSWNILSQIQTEFASYLKKERRRTGSKTKRSPLRVAVCETKRAIAARDDSDSCRFRTKSGITIGHLTMNFWGLFPNASPGCDAGGPARRWAASGYINQRTRTRCGGSESLAKTLPTNLNK
ncbi:hypothetical protein BD779DRAFT_1782257 [Infundibulicybe gibba]|nr:hypothetical protein BD779DRAFT_1782257 [Infundibulicybe gibba]